MDKKRYKESDIVCVEKQDMNVNVNLYVYNEDNQSFNYSQRTEAPEIISALFFFTFKSIMKSSPTFKSVFKSNSSCN